MTTGRRYFTVLAALGAALLAGCGGSQRPSGSFGGGGSGTGNGGTTLSGFVLTATARAAANELAWTPPVTDGATLVTYDLYRAAGTGPLALLAAGVGSAHDTDTAVQVGTTYRYQITAHAAGQTSQSNTDSATPGGPTSVGVGDPATNTPPSGSLFTAANLSYVTGPTGSRLTFDVTLSHAASVTDLRTLQIGATSYLPASGVTVSGNHLLFDSLAAGVAVPSLPSGQRLSVTVTVANTTNPVIPNAGRLEMTGQVPATGGTETDGPIGFRFTLAEHAVETARLAFSGHSGYTKALMNLSVGAKTDPGRRPNNEDQLLVLDVRRHHLRADGVLVIADGMGGRNFGERASGAAVETVGATLTEMLDADRDPHVPVGDALDSALRKANSRVYELAGSDEESKGMGTTCVAAVVEGDRVYVAHAGDSRAYRWRKGELLRLTDDHSYVAEQVRAGVLSEENARRSRFRNVITRAVGIEPTITPDVGEHDVQTGDALLLCTDGLTNMVSEEEIAQTLGQAATAQAAADRLVQMANLNGGRDNITAIVARVEVGTRTQRMRVNDLAQIVQPDADVPPDAAPSAPDAVRQNGVWQTAGGAPIEDETPTVQPPRPRPVPAEPAAPTASEFGEMHARRDRHGRPLAFGAGLLGLLAALLLASTLYLGRMLTQDGYEFQADPPFAVKPLPPPPPRPPDLAHVSYGDPSLLSTVPVSGDVLTRNPTDGSLTAVSLTGTVLVMSSDGVVHYKYPLPPRHLPARAASAASGGGAPVAVPAPVQRLHTATDPQGNFYVSDSGLRTIEKYSPNGEFLHYVSAGPTVLKQPQALAVGADGAVYVVDAQRLMVIPATPSTLK